jgi:alkylation response protein AidB-like acyl-CoA dehydrogenase
MTLSDEREYKLLYGASRKFAQKILLPEREENDRFPFSRLNTGIIEKAFELDFFHVWLPEKLGGMGGHLKKLILILQTIAETDASMAVMILSNALAQDILIQAGEDNTLETVCSGEKSAADFLIAYPAFTNPYESSTRVTAQKKDGMYCLNGETPYAVLGNFARYALVTAKIEGDNEDSYFLVSTKDGSCKIGDPILSLGLHACPVADLRFNGTEAVIVGERGKARDYFQSTFRALILAGASVAAGIMRGAFDDALAYSRSRVQGGRPIGNWSEVQMMLSGMALNVKNAETMVSYLSEQEEGGESAREDAIIAASLPIFDHALDVTTSGVQVLGGYGYMEDYSQEKRFRDARHLQTFLGSPYLKKIHFIKSFFKLAS